MIFECSYTKLYAGIKTIHHGIVISVFYNSENGRHEAAVLEVDKSFPTGYNDEVEIVPVEGLSIAPKKG
jgi:hypothetical protein